MKKLFLVTLCVFGCVGLNYAQTTKQANIESIFKIGIYSVIVAKENNADIYYSSGLTLAGSNLLNNQQVTIHYHNNENTTVHFFDANSNKIVCSKIISENQTTPPVILDLESITLEDGILFFTDKQHLDDTYEAIVNIIDTDTTHEETDILDDIANEFIGFTTFRETFNSLYVPEDGLFSDEELEYMFKRDFVVDEIEKTLLNQDRFIGIGNEIYYYHSLNNYIVFDKDRDDLKDLFKEIDQNFNLFTLEYEYEKYDSIYDDDSPLDSLVKTAFITLYFDKQFEIRNLEATIHSFDNRATTYDDDSTYKFKTDVITYSADCSTLRKGLSLSAQESKKNTSGGYDDIFPTRKGTLIVDWGDGTTDTYTNYGRYGSTVWHDYPSLGTYYPETEYIIEDDGGTTHNIFDGTNVTGGVGIEIICEVTCTKREVVKDTNQVSGNWRMYSALIIKGFLGNKIKGVTKSYKKKGNSWEEHKSDLYVEVHGWFRDVDCNDPTWRYGNKSRKLRKEISKTKPKVRKHWKFTNGDIWSIHTLKKGNLTLYKKHVLIPCP